MKAFYARQREDSAARVEGQMRYYAQTYGQKPEPAKPLIDIDAIYARRRNARGR